MSASSFLLLLLRNRSESGISHSSVSDEHAVFSRSLSDEFLGATSSSRLDFTSPPPPTVTIETPSEVVGSRGDAASDVTPSVSSDSVSLPTQLENLLETNAPGEDGKQEGAGASDEGAEEGGAKAEGAREQEARREGAKEEVAQDLRVFELNSDSGKSTPSTNGKKGEVERPGGGRSQ